MMASLFVVIACLIVVLLECAAEETNNALGDLRGSSAAIELAADRFSCVEGHVWHARLTAHGSSSFPLRVYPFVNQLQWGAYVTLARAGEAVNVTLPLPQAGTQEVVFATAAAGNPFTVGLALPTGKDVFLSNAVNVSVTRSPLRGQDVGGAGKTQLLMEWEPWFTPLNNRWQLAEAVPLVGLYPSLNRLVMRQHALWLAQAGVTGIVVDWTNNIWNVASWSERPPGATQLIDATIATLEEYSRLRTEGIPTPNVMLLLGLDNGPVAKSSVLNEEIDFIRRNVSSRFPDLLLKIDGKPALGIFDGGNTHASVNPPIDTTGFSVRYWSTQFQDNHLNEKGFWSWMDGTIAPLPTGQEVITVTNAFFGGNGKGWLFPPSLGQLGGSVLLREWAQVLKYTPKFTVVCQWNEFLGQAQGHGYGPEHNHYMDIYNVSLGNDMEPTSLTELGYRSQSPGWGLFYINLLRALHDYSDKSHLGSRILLTVAQPQRLSTIARSVPLRVAFHAMDSFGRVDTKEYSFEVRLGDKLLAQTSEFSATVDVSRIGKGPHTLTVHGSGTLDILSAFFRSGRRRPGEKRGPASRRSAYHSRLSEGVLLGMLHVIYRSDGFRKKKKKKKKVKKKKRKEFQEGENKESDSEGKDRKKGTRGRSFATHSEKEAERAEFVSGATQAETGVPGRHLGD